jgi:teichuronic acid biosynthesis glycosyltransferase TuaG
MSSISVIIPTWNRAETLVTAVNSALNQTYPVAEVLVCDDGSTDDSKKLITSLTDPRVRWIDCGRNGRPAIPRNIGARQSKSEWLAFLDSDDEWLPQKIERQMQGLNKHMECMAVCCNATKIYKNSTKEETFHTIDRRKFKFKDLATANYVICSSALIHRSMFENTGGFPEQEEFKGIEDYMLWLKISAFTEWAYLRESLLNYLDHPTESVRGGDLNVWQQRKIIFTDLLKWLDTQKLNVPIMHTAMAKQQLLLALYRTSENGWKRLGYRIRYAIS